jgi:protein-tyrosine phosphatase
MLKILFVCTGNICRSPTAEGLAIEIASVKGVSDQFEFDSAGTHAYHVGEPPDMRAQRAARKRGYDLSKLRARLLEPEDFERFDRVFAMDRSHLDFLQRKCPPQYHSKLDLFLNLSPAYSGRDVEDPYYGEADGFERVIDQCLSALNALLGK